MKPASSAILRPSVRQNRAIRKVSRRRRAGTSDGKPVVPGDSSNPANSGTQANSGANASAANPSTTPTSASNAPDPSTTLPASSYFVQVAAVSKQDDADALVDALKKKQYPAFVAANATTDKLFRIQVGPFPDIQEAEAMRTRLIGDGYNPIVKK